MPIQFEEWKYTLLKWAGSSLAPIAKAIIVFVVGWLLINLAMKMLARVLVHSKIEVTLHTFVLSLTRISLIVLLAVSCAVMSRLVDATSVVTALGAVGLAISLAVKDMLANMAGGLSVLASKPFVVGDYISTDGGIEGTVEKIDLIHTTLKTFDNKLIHVPNGKMNNSVVTNYTSQDLRRLDIEWSIGYKDDFECAKTALLELIAAHADALPEPVPFVRVTKLGENAVALTSRVWVKCDRYWDLRYDLLETGKRRFEALGLTFAYPQLDVHVKEQKQ